MTLLHIPVLLLSFIAATNAIVLLENIPVNYAYSDIVSIISYFGTVNTTDTSKVTDYVNNYLWSYAGYAVGSNGPSGYTFAFHLNPTSAEASLVSTFNGYSNGYSSYYYASLIERPSSAVHVAANSPYPAYYYYVVSALASGNIYPVQELVTSSGEPILFQIGLGEWSGAGPYEPAGAYSGYGQVYCPFYTAYTCTSLCTAGQYVVSTTSSDTCTDCAAGTSASIINTLSCTTCAAGTYSAAGASTCTLCGEGTYSDATGATTCASCGAGTYSSVTGATSPATCALCGAGTYSSATGATSSATCTSCGAGTYSAAGASTCTSCGAGTYSSATGASSCTQCGIGTASDAIGATSSSTCSTCIPGQIAASPGSTGCTLCNPGLYASSYGSSSCTTCAAGSCTTGFAYEDYGASGCTSCSAGTYSGAGSTSCSSCTAGSISSTGATSCTQCTAGTYDTGTETTCATCASGSMSTAGAASCIYTAVSGQSGFYIDCSTGNVVQDVSGTVTLYNVASTGAICNGANTPLFDPVTYTFLTSWDDLYDNQIFEVTGGSVICIYDLSNWYPYTFDDGSSFQPNAFNSGTCTWNRT